MKKDYVMKHLRKISMTKAQDDAFGFIFLQLWLAAFTTLLTGAFSEAKDK